MATTPFPLYEQPDAACPHCGAPKGKPLKVTTKKDENGAVEITMGCKECKNTWMLQKLMHDDPPS